MSEERREMDADHDLLVRVDQNLANLIRTIDIHMLDDKSEFKNIKDIELKNIKTAVVRISNAFYICFGAGVVLQIVVVAWLRNVIGG